MSATTSSRGLPAIVVELAELECALRRSLPETPGWDGDDDQLERTARQLADMAWIELSRGGFVAISRLGDQHEVMR